MNITELLNGFCKEYPKLAKSIGDDDEDIICYALGLLISNAQDLEMELEEDDEGLEDAEGTEDPEGLEDDNENIKDS